MSDPVRACPRLWALVVAGFLGACPARTTTGRLPVAPIVAAAKPAVVTAPPAAAPPLPPPPPALIRSFEGIDEYLLANGLRVLLFHDPTQSTVTVNVTYLVGSRHEGAGETGMAHLLEHMMFKGTPAHRNVLKLLDARGAFANGTTWQDRTNYFETLPAAGDNLAWALALEADRMVNATISADDLATEFSVVRNELEAGENDPRAILEQRVTAAAYQWHGYGRDTIGSRSDVEHVPPGPLRRFYQRYYQPDNALLVIAGKFDPTAALAEVAARFGGLPRPTRVLEPSYTVEPVQDGERLVTLRRTGDVHLLLALYHGVAGADPDHAAFDALADLLTRDPTGRLHRALVTPGLAAEVDARQYLFRDPSYLVVEVKATDGATAGRARQLLLATVEGFARAPVTSAEVERWRATTLKDLTLELADSQQVAIELSEWAAAGDWRLMFAYRDRVKALTAPDVQRVATAYLKASNRTLGEFVPTATPDRAAAPGQPDVAALVAALAPTPGAAGEAFDASLANLATRTSLVELPGGLRAALLPKATRGHKAYVELVLRHGDATSLAGQAAVADLLGRLVERGTTRHSHVQLEDAKDRLIANVAVRASAGQVAVSIETVRDSVPAVVALVADVLRNPALAAGELEVVRREAVSEAEEALQDPSELGAIRFQQLLTPWAKADPRATLTPAEAIAALKAVTRAQLRAYHRRFWGTGHGELAAVGDFDPAALTAALAVGLDGWASPAPYARLAPRAWHPAPISERIDTRDKDMAIIVAGTELAMADADPDAAAAEVAGHILGGSTGSRLWTRLREHDGFSYGVWGTIEPGAQDPVGAVTIGAILAPHNLDQARAALREELTRLRDAGVTADEVAAAVTALVEQDDNLLADDRALAGVLRDDQFLGRTFEWRVRRRAALARVTPADVARVVRSTLAPDHLIWVEAGDQARRAH